MLASDRKGLVWSGAVLIAIMAALWLLYTALSVVLLTLGAILFAIFLDGLTIWTERYTGLSRTWALTLVALVLLLSVAAFVILSLPQLTAQGSQLIEQLPQAMQQLREILEALGIPAAAIPQAGDQSTVRQVAATVASTIDLLFAVLVVTVVGLYFSGDPRRYRASVARIFPKTARRRVLAALDDVGITLRRWLMGRALLMIVNGVLTTLGLWMLGVPLAPILGLTAGLLNFVPNLGPIVAAIPALLIALSQSYTTVAYVAGLYFLLQNIDGYILTPLVDEKTVELPQAYNLVFQILAGVLAGTAGVLLATPLLAVCRVVLDHVRPSDLEPEDEAPPARTRPVPAAAHR